MIKLNETSHIFFKYSWKCINGILYPEEYPQCDIESQGWDDLGHGIACEYIQNRDTLIHKCPFCNEWTASEFVINGVDENKMHSYHYATELYMKLYNISEETIKYYKKYMNRRLIRCLYSEEDDIILILGKTWDKMLMKRF